MIAATVVHMHLSFCCGCYSQDLAAEDDSDHAAFGVLGLVKACCKDVTSMQIYHACCMHSVHTHSVAHVGNPS